MIDAMEGAPNPTMESHFDYGPRAGYWRIARVLGAYGATCTLNACAEAIALSPWLAHDAVARGFEISCHGYRWLSAKGMSEVEEREWIRRAVETIGGGVWRAPGRLAHALSAHARTPGACSSRKVGSSTTATPTTTTYPT